MKKLMIAGALAMAALCSQAVTVQWNTAALTAPTSADNPAPGSTKFGNVLGDWTITFQILSANGQNVIVSEEALMHVYKSSNGATKRDITGITLDSGIGDTASWSSTTGFSVKKTYADVAADADYLWTITVSGTPSSAAGVDYATCEKTLANQAVHTNGAATPTDMKGSVVTSWGTQTWTTTAVPEPTSAMLILLGVAGLALRRRRA